MSLLSSFLPTHTRTAQSCDCDNGEVALGETVQPTYQVQETGDAYHVTVQLPGVTKDGLEFTADDAQLSIVGRRQWQKPEGWTALHRESADAAYELVLTHENAIDADNIGAELTAGVLRVTLPKREALKPRKIAVN